MDIDTVTMDKEDLKVFKAMIHAQATIEQIESLDGSKLFRQQLKMKGKTFCAELDNVLKDIYNLVEIPSPMIHIMDKAQKAFDDVIEEEMKALEKSRLLKIKA